MTSRVGFSLVCLIAIVLQHAPRAVANDSAAAYGAGGITFKKIDGIVMESENLTISPFEVTVSYVFRNVTASDIKTMVAFPLPMITKHDEDEDINIDMGAPNPVHFELTINGQPRRFQTEIKKTKRTFRVTYHWIQTFPAGKQVFVSHKYKPIHGSFFTSDYEGTRKPFTRLFTSTYCAEPSLLDWLLKAQRTVFEVHYILRTGANWQGPIGKFSLTIRKNNADQKVSLCTYPVRQMDPTTFVWEKTNFTPTKDLKIIFAQAVKKETG
jgi:hypothetical protein